ncbi:MAG: SRPBCC domain-containing protein, partial [Pseudobdellovibrio sp.]
LLKKEFKLTTWWQQEVARGYQIAIGLRVPNQTLKGTYTTTATKSISTTAKKIFSFMVSDEGQQLWLKPLYKVKVKEKQNFECQGGIFGEFRTVESGKRLRFTWIDEEWPNKSTVQINIYLKPKDRCMIAIDHVDLPTLKAKTQMHERWRAAVDDLAEALQ